MFNPAEIAFANRRPDTQVLDARPHVFHRQQLAKRRTPGATGVSYYLYRARRPDPKRPLLVAVHGIQRLAREQAVLFAPLVEALGGTVVAPYFGRNRFADFQRLGRLNKGERADLALKRVLADVADFTAIDTRRVVLFGYSGGGQFVHRFAMAHPRQVLRMAVAAPGWFTFPQGRLSFPHGTGATPALPDLIFDPARFLTIPTLVVVGARDTARDDALNQRPKLDRRQGRNRVERGRRWVSAMSAQAARYGYETPYTFRTVPDSGHSFEECMTVGGMGTVVMRFLYPPSSSADAGSKAIKFPN